MSNVLAVRRRGSQSPFSAVGKAVVERVVRYYGRHGEAMPWCCAQALGLPLRTIYEVTRVSLHTPVSPEVSRPRKKR